MSYCQIQSEPIQPVFMRAATATMVANQRGCIGHGFVPTRSDWPLVGGTTYRTSPPRGVDPQPLTSSAGSSPCAFGMGRARGPLHHGATSPPPAREHFHKFGSTLEHVPSSGPSPFSYSTASALPGGGSPGRHAHQRFATTPNTGHSPTGPLSSRPATTASASHAHMGRSSQSPWLGERRNGRGKGTDSCLARDLAPRRQVPARRMRAKAPTTYTR